MGSTILLAALCVSVTLATAWWSSWRVENDRTRALAAPVRIVPARTPPHQTTVASAPEPTPVSDPTPPTVEEPAKPAPVAPAPPPAAPPAPAPTVPTQPAAQLVVPAGSSIPPVALPPTAEETSARLAMVDLHHRGDIAVGQGQFDEALGFYEKAVDSARGTAPNASPDAKTEAALLCRKLGTLQLQMASTSEARASFVQGRKILLQVKKEGHWNAARARVLAEIETSLRRLPRD